MNLPTTKPNDRDLAWYVRECEALQCINAALKKQANDEFDAVITRNMELERENAALRAELNRQRALWQATHALGLAEREFAIKCIEMALRKEAQP